MLNSVYESFYNTQNISKEDFIKSFEAYQQKDKFSTDDVFTGQLSVEAISNIFDGLDSNGDGIIDNFDFAKEAQNISQKEEYSEDDINLLSDEVGKLDFGASTKEEQNIVSKINSKTQEINDENKFINNQKLKAKDELKQQETTINSTNNDSSRFQTNPFSSVQNELINKKIKKEYNVFATE